MISYSHLKTMFQGLSFDCEEYNIETNSIIDLPYAVYILTNANTVSADGSVLMSTLSIRLILVDTEITSSSQNELDNLLDSNDVFYTKAYDYEEDERIYSVTYEFEVLDYGGEISI